MNLLIGIHKLCVCVSNQQNSRSSPAEITAFNCNRTVRKIEAKFSQLLKLLVLLSRTFDNRTGTTFHAMAATANVRMSLSLLGQAGARELGQLLHEDEVSPLLFCILV